MITLEIWLTRADTGASAWTITRDTCVARADTGASACTITLDVCVLRVLMQSFSLQVVLS
mgnify:CR=1 FL=1